MWKTYRQFQYEFVHRMVSLIDKRSGSLRLSEVLRTTMNNSWSTFPHTARTLFSAGHRKAMITIYSFLFLHSYAVFRSQTHSFSTLDDRDAGASVSLHCTHFSLLHCFSIMFLRFSSQLKKLLYKKHFIWSHVLVFVILVLYIIYNKTTIVIFFTDFNFKPKIFSGILKSCDTLP